MVGGQWLTDLGDKGQTNYSWSRKQIYKNGKWVSEELQSNIIL